MAKENLMLNRHDIQVGPGDEVVRGAYFTPDDEIAKWWNAAYGGFLKSDNIPYFRGVMVHEYVEAKLLEAGMPYLSSHPDAWDDEGPVFNPEHFGAHNVAPRSFSPGPLTTEKRVGSLELWPAYGIEVPSIPVADDLSNLDVWVEAAKRSLGL
ncbi:hypothetical protein GXW82_35690 [Streptacidiphilus sp. 4-A2]|nr:hypothetical protein [Streptacidiphilus sp. 4-A2]